MAERVPGRGRPRTARTADNVATIEGLLRSQEDKPQTHRTVCETARETGIHRSSVHRIIRKDLACHVCRYSNNDSLKCACNYCVDGSICHFKFPKAVLARISREVGTLCTVGLLLNVYSRTRLPIFIEIGSYVTDTEQKKSWHVFYWDTVYSYLLYRLNLLSEYLDSPPPPFVTGTLSRFAISRLTEDLSSSMYVLSISLTTNRGHARRFCTQTHPLSLYVGTHMTSMGASYPLRTDIASRHTHAAIKYLRHIVAKVLTGDVFIKHHRSASTVWHHCLRSCWPIYAIIPATTPVTYWPLIGNHMPASPPTRPSLITINVLKVIQGHLNGVSNFPTNLPATAEINWFLTSVSHFGWPSKAMRHVILILFNLFLMH